MTIGTDHHRFDRLIGWIDRVLATRPHLAHQAVVQHGQSAPSAWAQNHEFLSYEELTNLMGSSDVVIAHGGPATIFEARARGRMPLCVPRDPTLGEVVDSHQQRFARRLAADSLVHLAEDQPTFEKLLGMALDDPPSVRIADDASRVLQTAERLDAYVTRIVETQQGHGGRRP